MNLATDEYIHRELYHHWTSSSLKLAPNLSVLVTCFQAGFLLDLLFFNPEDGGEMFLRNVS
jgi:hypothetical protein